MASLCSGETCPVEAGYMQEAPSLTGSAVFLAGFGILVLANFFNGAKYGTTLFSTALLVGLSLEIIGYIGRILLADNLANRTYFTLFLIGTVVGPAIISAAVYLIVPHVLAIYGEDLIIIKPAVVGYMFFALDLFTVAFETVGCVFAAQGYSKMQMQQGLNILEVGLGIQCASLVAFTVLLGWFSLRVRRRWNHLDEDFADIYRTINFKIYLLCTQLSVLFILIRTICRIVSLSGGFGSNLAQSEVVFLVLDGAEVLVASIILTIATPGAAFGRAWRLTSPSESTRNRADAVPLHQSTSPGFRSYVAKSNAVSPQTYRSQREYPHQDNPAAPYDLQPDDVVPFSPPPNTPRFQRKMVYTDPDHLVNHDSVW